RDDVHADQVAPVGVDPRGGADHLGDLVDVEPLGGGGVQGHGDRLALQRPGRDVAVLGDLVDRVGAVAGLGLERAVTGGVLRDRDVVWPEHAGAAAADVPVQHGLHGGRDALLVVGGLSVHSPGGPHAVGGEQRAGGIDDGD